MWFILIILTIGYCEFLWRVMIAGRRTPDSVQMVMKYYLYLNAILFIVFHTLGGLILLSIVSLYYMVIIPQRIWKVNNGPVA